MVEGAPSPGPGRSSLGPGSFEAVAAGESAGPWYERALFRLRTGDRQGAIGDLRRAAELAPGWPPPRELLNSLRGGLVGRPEADPPGPGVDQNSGAFQQVEPQIS